MSHALLGPQLDAIMAILAAVSVAGDALRQAELLAEAQQLLSLALRDAVKAARTDHSLRAVAACLHMMNSVLCRQLSSDGPLLVPGARPYYGSPRRTAADVTLPTAS